MDEHSPTKRRQFLRGAGLGGGVLLAGCTDSLGLGGDGQSATDGSDGSGDVAAVASIDRQSMQEEQATIREKMANGELNQSEAQQQMMDVREQYVSDGVDALTGKLEETDGVGVTDEYASLGAVVVDGEPGPILGVLGTEEVSALVPADDVKSQAQSQGGEGQ